MPFMQGRMLASARGSMISIAPYRTAKYPYCLTKRQYGYFLCNCIGGRQAGFQHIRHKRAVISVIAGGHKGDVE